MATALKFVKVHDINQIPRYLFEQIKPREFDIDRLYEWAPIMLDNPMNLLGAFLDKQANVKGVLWASFSPITNKIHVHILSVDRLYFGKGIVHEVDGLVNKWKRKLNADGIVLMTTRPKAIDHAGYRRSRLIVMEK